MKKFLAQFKLTPMQELDLESFIFTQAGQMVKGYLGGMWESKKVGSVYIIVIPGDAETIELHNYMFGGGITTDILTASAAFSSIVANWYMGLRYEQGRINDAAVEAISDYGYNLRAACEQLPDAGAFLRFID